MCRNLKVESFRIMLKGLLLARTIELSITFQRLDNNKVAYIYLSTALKYTF